MGYYQDFIAQRRGDPSSQAELIAVQERLEESARRPVGAGRGRPADPAVRSPRSERPGLGRQPSGDEIDAITEDFAQRRLDSLHDFRELSLPERRARFLELARANDRAMRATLTPAQLQRLEQITLQLQGPRVFGQSEVVARLHLTDAQRQAIRQIESEAFAPAWNFGGEPGGERPPPGGEPPPRGGRGK